MRHDAREDPDIVLDVMTNDRSGEAMDIARKGRRPRPKIVNIIVD